MKRIETEILVIGSGFGASAPALRLAQAGLQVLIIEKGPDIQPERDFRNTQDPKYLLKYLKGVSSSTASFTYAEGLGGGSGFYEMVSLRAPSIAFDQVDEQGRRLWPVGLDRRTLDPYYTMAEKMLHVEQIASNRIPKSGVVFSNLMKNLGYSCDRARYAVKGCIGSGYCVSGCVYGAKQSLHLNYLPQAIKAGAQIMTDVEALDIRTLINSQGPLEAVSSISEIPFRFSVQCQHKSEIIDIRSKAVILGGGTVGTAALLLRSKPQLRHLSRHVGQNIAFNGSVKTAGLLPENFMAGDMLSGQSHPGMISYHFLESLGITIAAAKPLPLQLLTSAHLVPEGELRKPSWWGEANVDLMKQYRRRMIVLYALGMTPPTAEIRIRGNNVKPYLKVTADLEKYYKQTQSLLNSLFSRNGCRVIHTRRIDHEGREQKGINFGTAHMMGSCRMADRPEDGVVDVNGQVFGYPGLYISDGAAIPASLAVNSSLTILANAERVAEHLVHCFAYGRVRSSNSLVADIN